MYLNENKLNNIVNEVFEKNLKEGFFGVNNNQQSASNQQFNPQNIQQPQNPNNNQPQNTSNLGNQQNTQFQNSNGDFNDDYVNANRANRPSGVGTQLGKGVLKGAATLVGAGVGGGVLGTMLGMNPAAMGGLGWALAGVGGVMLLKNLAGNLMALNRVKKLKFPRSLSNAMEYAKFAAAERAEAQDMCKKIQMSLQNAISGYNKAYNQNLDTNDNTIFGGEKATFQDRNKEASVSVNWDKDFSNKNAGKNESKIYEDYQSMRSLNQQTYITSAEDFYQQFQQMQQQDAINSIIVPLKEEYVKAYGLWMQWTRYINVLVHTYGDDGLTWEVVIDSNNSSDSKSIIKQFLKNKLGIKDPKSIDTYQGKNAEYTITARVKVLSYPIGKTTYVLVKDINSASYYALPHFTDIEGVQITKEMPLNISISRDMIKSTSSTKDGKKVNILSPNIMNNISLIKDNNNQAAQI